MSEDRWQEICNRVNRRLEELEEGDDQQRAIAAFLNTPVGKLSQRKRAKINESIIDHLRHCCDTLARENYELRDILRKITDLAGGKHAR